MTQDARHLPDSLYIGTVPAGTTFATCGDKLIAVHPEHPPLVVTPEGLKPLEPADEVVLSPGFTMSCIVGATR